MAFYTYAHMTVDADEVFYIGKGKGVRCASSNVWSKF